MVDAAKPIDIPSILEYSKECLGEKDCYNELNKDPNLMSAYYKYTHTILVSDSKSDCLRNSLNRPYLKIDLQRNGDIIADFECNAEYSILLRDNEVKTTRLIPLCLAFFTYGICLFLDGPNTPDEIVFTMKIYHFNRAIRRKLFISSTPEGGGLVDENILYRSGLVTIL